MYSSCRLYTTQGPPGDYSFHDWNVLNIDTWPTADEVGKVLFNYCYHVSKKHLYTSKQAITRATRP